MELSFSPLGQIVEERMEFKNTANVFVWNYMWHTMKETWPPFVVWLQENRALEKAVR